MKHQSIILFMCAGAIAFGCNDAEDESTPSLGWEFLPLEVGAFVEYRADSIYHDQPDVAIPGVHDTISYFIREKVESMFEDAAGEKAFRLERYKKQSQDDPWELRDVWFLKRTARSVDKIEENVRYIKLGIPIAPATSWDGNAANDLPEWQYSYDSLFVSRTYGDVNFPRTVKVNQRDNKNFVEDELAFEIYAENVGLIYRYHRELDTRLEYTNFPIADNIRRGIEFKWEVINYGTQ